MMKRVLLVAGAILAILFGAATWFSYPLWGGWGAWHDMPITEAPASSRLVDDRFADAGADALEALSNHRYEHGFPAITAAVSYRGELVWSGATGWSDLYAGTPAHAGTTLRIGSTSKAVTATALARLIDAGEMSLDAPISDYAGNWPNPLWQDLTPRQLGSHTAGLPEYSNNSDRAGQYLTLCGCRHYETVRDSLSIVDSADLLFLPGTDFSYSSFDVNILGAAIAASQGRPYLDVLHEQVFDPLGLDRSGGDADGTDRPDLARFYETDGERARLWRPFDLSQRWPGGGLVSTSEELVIIGGAWLNPNFISPETRDAMWTPQPLADGSVNEQSYAIGWRFYPEATWPGDEERRLPYAHHGGVSKGAMSWLVVYPDYELSIAVNINTRAETFGTFASVEDQIAVLFLERIEAMRTEAAE